MSTIATPLPPRTPRRLASATVVLRPWNPLRLASGAGSAIARFGMARLAIAGLAIAGLHGVTTSSVQAHPIPKQGEANPKQPDTREQKVLADATKKLRSFAAYCLKRGDAARAETIYRLVLSHYSTDDAASRRALGYSRIGEVWQSDAAFEFPKPKPIRPALAKTITRKWDRLANQLAKKHREFGQKLASAGEASAERSRWHFQRILDLLPDDEAAARALGLERTHGIFATPTERKVIERSRRIDEATAKQRRAGHAVRRVETKHPLFDAVAADYQTVASEHFVVYGDIGVDALTEAALHAERTLALCRETLGDIEDFSADRIAKHHAYFRDRGTWAAILREGLPPARNRDAANPDNVAMFIPWKNEQVYLLNVSRYDWIRDFISRHVAQRFSGFRSVALREGIGHVFVGRLHGESRVTLRPLNPSASTAVRVWAEDVQKMVEHDSGTPLAQLLAATNDNFPEDGRLKSWSFCEYMVRRDPAMLAALDRATRAADSPRVLAERFAAATDQSIEALDRAWSEFWRQASPASRVALQSVASSDLDPKVAAWLQAFNQLRKQHHRQPVAWSPSLSVRCRQHVDYLAAHPEDREPARDGSRDPGQDGASSTEREFAEVALIFTKEAKATEAMTRWLARPRYRYAFLDPELREIGLHVSGSIAVLDATRGRVPATVPQHYPYPVVSAKGVRRSVPVGELDPQLQSALDRAGKGRLKRVGLPISLHFSHQVPKPADSFRCRVRRADNPRVEVEGLIHVARDRRGLPSLSPGLVTFVPFEPLKKRTVYQLRWQWYRGFAFAQFTTE